MPQSRRGRNKTVVQFCYPSLRLVVGLKYELGVFLTPCPSKYPNTDKSLMWQIILSTISCCFKFTVNSTCTTQTGQVVISWLLMVHSNVNFLSESSLISGDIWCVSKCHGITMSFPALCYYIKYTKYNTVYRVQRDKMSSTESDKKSTSLNYEGCCSLEFYSGFC